MSALISALDSRKSGENGHIEHAWSSDTQEQILQFSFQLVRTKDTSTIAAKLLSILQSKPSAELLCILYKMIGQTRDIVAGKGEYSLTYMMIYTWYRVHPKLALFALDACVQAPDGIHPYGSWKDIKYFCQYCKEQGLAIAHPLIQHCILIVNRQLAVDLASDKPSLLAKWTPRENTTSGWLFNALACDYFKSYFVRKTTVLALNKAKMEYRKLISGLNKKLDTVQIKQCANTWSAIDHNKTTSVTMSRQKKAFLNLKKNGECRSYLDDRIICATNFEEYVNASVKSGKEIKGGNIGMEEFTKKAFDARSSVEKEVVNSQWRSNSAKTGKLGNMIAMVDSSGSMAGDPLHCAIALGIRVAEKSVVGKRVLTFNTTPVWFNLEPYPEFCDMALALQSSPWGGSTNFGLALQLILDVIREKRLTVTDVSDMVLAVFSDMQMDQAGSQPLMTSIETKYHDLGMEMYGVPFTPPHILFWNLRSTTGFPSLSTQKNASMMSGFSPALLNLFCEKGMAALQSSTPWSMLVESLNNPRYLQLEEFIMFL